MKALVLVNGELYRPAILRNRVHENAFDLVIGVDGGSGHALPLNVGLDAIIGDMDSLTDLDKKDINNIELVSYPPEKDETDLELALLYAKKRGADEIIMVGALGGRMEMTLANVLMLADPDLSPCKVKVWHGEQTAWAIKPPGEHIAGNPGDTVSLIPLGTSASGITTEGLKYPLKDEKLTIGLTRGISNLLEKSPAHIRLSEGLLLVVHTPAEYPEYRKGGNVMAERRTVNVGVQVLPLGEDVYSIVDKAIAVIQASGVKYEVGPLETTLEGDDLDQLLEVAKSAHRACFAAGAGKVVTIIKIADALEGTSIEGKVGKYRKACR